MEVAGRRVHLEAFEHRLRAVPGRGVDRALEGLAGGALVLERLGGGENAEARGEDDKEKS